MKTLLRAAVLVGLLVGCDKEEPAPPPAPVTPEAPKTDKQKLIDATREMWTLLQQAKDDPNLEPSPEVREKGRKLENEVKSLAIKLAGDDEREQTKFMDALIKEHIPEAYETLVVGRLKASCRALLRTVQSACDRYRLDHATYPKSGNANLVKALIRPENPNLVLLTVKEDRISDKGELLDSWNNPIVYRMEGFERVLYSLGPNGKDEEGEGDDITP